MAKRNLVYLRAGDNSLHSSWVVPREKRNYDLFISYFGDRPGIFQDDGEYYEAATGLKFPAVTRLLKEKSDLIYSYNAIWIPDDDLLTCAEYISRMFELFHKHKLQLAQPALAPGSYLAHPVTAMMKGKSLHFTRYVEVMCPIFSRFALKKLADTFSLSVSSWGIDAIWGHRLGYPSKRIAVLDETPVVHTRPIGKGSFYDAIKGKKISPAAEGLKLIKRYKIASDWEIVRRRNFGSVPLRNSRQPGEWMGLHSLQEMIDKDSKSPIFYENRAQKLKLKKHERVDVAAITGGDCNQAREKNGGDMQYTVLKKLMHSEVRLRAIAKDFIKHWAMRQKMRSGKTMIVCMDRKAGLKLFKVLGVLRPRWRRDGLLGIDFNRQAGLAKRFKDPDGPLDVVIVDSLDAQEFHSPVLHTIYMDIPKPVEQHHHLVGQLMRIFQNRLATLVVDYAGLSDATFIRHSLAPAVSTTVEGTRKVSVEIAPPAFDKMLNGRPESEFRRHDGEQNGILKAGQRIAHLFLIRRRINHERIWKKFFDGYESYFSIYVHAKERDQIASRLLRGKHISGWCETAYGHISLVRAELLLLEEALKNKENEFFLLHSESCVPIRSFEYVYRQLFATGRSWLHSFKDDMWRYYGIRPTAVPLSAFFKSSQFFCLTRSHAQMVLDHGGVDDWVKCSCADEHYIPTILAINGKLGACSPRQLTFTEWNRQRREGGWGPATYHKLLPRDLKALTRTESLFARKFAPDSDISQHIGKLCVQADSRTTGAHVNC
jgi:hypothetical protein